MAGVLLLCAAFLLPGFVLDLVLVKWLGKRSWRGSTQPAMAITGIAFLAFALVGGVLWVAFMVFEPLPPDFPPAFVAALLCTPVLAYVLGAHTAIEKVLQLRLKLVTVVVLTIVHVLVLAQAVALTHLVMEGHKSLPDLPNPGNVGPVPPDASNVGPVPIHEPE